LEDFPKIKTVNPSEHQPYSMLFSISVGVVIFGAMNVIG
jgi:hypothetical protein